MLCEKHPQRNKRNTAGRHVRLAVFLLLSLFAAKLQADPQDILVINFRPIFPAGMDYIEHQRKHRLPGEKSKIQRVQREPIHINRIIDADELGANLDVFEEYITRAPVFSDSSEINCLNLDSETTDLRIISYCKNVMATSLIAQALSYILPAEADARLKFTSVPHYRLCFAHAAIAESVLQNHLGALSAHDFPKLVEKMEGLKRQFLESEVREVKDGILSFDYKGFHFEIPWGERGFSRRRGKCFQDYSGDAENDWPNSSLSFQEIPKTYEEFVESIFDQLNIIYLRRTFYKVARDYGLDYVKDYRRDTRPQHWEIVEEYKRMKSMHSPLRRPAEDKVFIKYVSYSLYFGNEPSDADEKILANRIREALALIDSLLDEEILQIEKYLASRHRDLNEEDLTKLVQEHLADVLPDLRRNQLDVFLRELMKLEALKLEIEESEFNEAEFIWKNIEEIVPIDLHQTINNYRQRKIQNLPEPYFPSSLKMETDEKGRRFMKINFLLEVSILEYAYEALGGLVYAQIEDQLISRWNNENLLMSLREWLVYPVVLVWPTTTFWDFSISPAAHTASEATLDLASHLTSSNLRNVMEASVRIYHRRWKADEKPPIYGLGFSQMREP